MLTAEQLYDFCYDELIPAADGIAAIEARDNAVARAAKLELLESLLTHAMPAYGIPVVSADVIRAYLDKYGAAKEPV